MSKDKKLLMAALLAVAVSTQGLAQPEALSEDELEEVSAQGLQIVENHNVTFNQGGPLNSQNNNLDSVQGNDTSMKKANIGYGAVLANSAVNSTSNYLYDAQGGGGGTPPPPPPPPGGGGDKIFSEYFDQSNENIAKNHYNYSIAEYESKAANKNKQTQQVNTTVADGEELKIISQNNNNNSVQLNDNTQRESTGIILINAAASAVNAGDNIFYASSVLDTEGYQTNNQTAKNFENYSETLISTAKSYNKEDSELGKAQVINNGGLKLADSNTQKSKNVTIVEQNNNNNSVQLNDNAQKKANFVAIKNIANSAANNGINAVYVSNKFEASQVSQLNTQNARNHVNTAKVSGPIGSAYAYNENKQGQLIDNATFDSNNFEGNAVINSQNNNNNSIQLNDDAQRQASGVIIENAAMSAVNKGVNIFGVGEVVDSAINQTNNQTAVNFDNTALGKEIAYAYNSETNEAQWIINGMANVISQDNNNNSVQINDNGQRNAKGLVIENVANSAENTGINVLSGGDLLTFEAAQAGNFVGSLNQTNTQVAKNHDNYAQTSITIRGTSEAKAYNLNKERQVVTTENRSSGSNNILQIEDQDNNNNSVQLNSNAQYEAIGGVISNSSMSSNNFGSNVMAVGDILTSEINQVNVQTATNFNNTAEEGLTSYAYNKENGETQLIENINEYTDIIDMDNNNNSVQLNDSSQKKAKGVIIANTANSATNTGINGLVTGNITGDQTAYAPTIIKQTNTQKAENHLNTATAYEVAIAANQNKQTQVISNFNVDDYDRLAEITLQNNNNNSVQLNNNSQMETNSVVIENASLSGNNTGINLLTTGDINVPPTNTPSQNYDPTLYDNITDSLIEQNNFQTASNFMNSSVSYGGDAYASNVEDSGRTFKGQNVNGQVIENVHTKIVSNGIQNNNNNSVQLNNNAQSQASGLVISNIANSATNIAVNMMTTGDITGTSIMQNNEQIAQNHVNFAYAMDQAFAGNVNKQKQFIYNCNCFALDGEQNNNMNSVQMNDNAQAGVNTLALVNSSTSAANIGINLLHAGTVSGSAIIQRNVSTAENFTNTAEGFTAKAINAENITNPLPW